MAEVARRLQVPTGTVKSRTFEARRRLRKALVKSGVVGVVAALAAIAGTILPGVRPDSRTTEWPTVSRAAMVPPLATVPPTIVPTPARGAAQPIRDREVLPAVALSRSPVQVPVVAFPSIEAPAVRPVEIVEIAVVEIPAVEVPVVHVPVVQVPVVNRIPPAGLSEKQRHSEKQQ